MAKSDTQIKDGGWRDVHGEGGYIKQFVGKHNKMDQVKVWVVKPTSTSIPDPDSDTADDTLTSPGTYYERNQTVHTKTLLYTKVTKYLVRCYGDSALADKYVEELFAVGLSDVG